MKMWRLFFFTSLTITFSLPALIATAQYDTTSFYVKQYMASDGLPDSYTLNVYQDQKQYLWVGTYSGMSRFDGISFTNFGVHNGFTDLYINHIVEFDQRLWIGNRTSIGYFENNTYVKTGFEDSTNLYFVFGFAEVMPGKLWVFTSKGLYEWNGSIWIKNRIIPTSKEQLCISAVRLNDQVYFCYNNRLIVRYKNGAIKTIMSSPGNKPFFTEMKLFGNELYILTKQGLAKLKNDQLIPLFAAQLRQKTISFFYRDSEKRFWIAAREDGLLVSEPGNEQELAHKIDMRVTLVSAICEDRGHNIWVTEYTGLLKIRQSFFSFPVLPGTFSNSHSYVPFKNATGQLHIYDDKNGLMRLNGNKLQLQNFGFKKNNSGPDNTTHLLSDIVTDDKDNYWLSARNLKLIKVNAKGQQKEMRMPAEQQEISNASVLVWWPALRKNLCGNNRLYIIENDSLQEFKPKNSNQPLEFITRMLALQNGNLLVNCRKTGLWLLTPAGNAYMLSKQLKTEPDGRLNFTEDQSGKVWIAYTGKGLHRYVWSNDTALLKETEVTALQGLPNDIVEAMTIDHKNRLWAATLSGLVVMDTLPGTSGKSFIIYNVGKTQGLDFNVYIGFSKLITDSSGDIWLCNSNNIIRFHPGLLNVYAMAPVTHIEQLLLNMKKADWSRWSKSSDPYFMLPQNLSLPYNQNTLTFSFKGINYNSDEKVWYSYKLEGVDSIWSPPSLSNSISFIKLTPGHFKFMIRSRNSNSPWSEPAQFSFTVKEPFWGTFWFRALAILITSFILAWIFRMQLLRVRKRAALQSQLHNLEMKALKAQMNPHFIYNALNSIQSLVMDKRNEEAQDYMVKFSRLLRQVLNHSEANVITLDKELSSLSIYIELEALRLHYSLQYFIDVDEKIITEKEWLPPLILQPFVENALWHGLSNKQGDKILTIHITEDDEWLICTITDNGIGRKKKDTAEMLFRDKGPRGTDITRGRLATFNQTSADEAVQIIDLKNEDDSPAGTSVILKVKKQ